MNCTYDDDGDGYAADNAEKCSCIRMRTRTRTRMRTFFRIRVLDRMPMRLRIPII